MNKRIDINCDLGEGLNNEALLMPYISSCSIACGGHAGDKESMAEVTVLAQRYQVKTGAHPSYPDKINFGRKTMTISDQDLTKSIEGQLHDFVQILKFKGAQLHHIKAHGALYNDIAKDIWKAKVFLEAVASYREKAFIFVPYGSAIEKEAINRGFKIKREAFGDRNYNADLSLVSRDARNALLEKPENVLKHTLRIVQKGVVRSVEGTNVKIHAETICIHGDSPNALRILMYLSQQLPKNQVTITRD